MMNYYNYYEEKLGMIEAHDNNNEIVAHTWQEIRLLFHSLEPGGRLRITIKAQRQPEEQNDVSK